MSEASGRWARQDKMPDPTACPPMAGPRRGLPALASICIPRACTCIAVRPCAKWVLRSGLRPAISSRRSASAIQQGRQLAQIMQNRTGLIFSKGRVRRHFRENSHESDGCALGRLGVNHAVSPIEDPRRRASDLAECREQSSRVRLLFRHILGADDDLESVSESFRPENGAAPGVAPDAGCP